MRLARRRAAWSSASTSRAAWRGTCRPAAVLRRRRPPGARRQRDLDGDGAKIQERNSDSGDIIKVQVDDQPEDVRVKLQEAFAEAAGVEPADVSVASVSATWGEEITRKAVQALVVFLALIAIYISFRFEWRMALDGDPRHDPRRRRQRRHLLDLRLRGHAGDRRRLPHRARLLAVRHDRRVRPHPGERAAGRGGRADGRRPRQRLDQPGADALDQHDAVVGAAR